MVVRLLKEMEEEAAKLKEMQSQVEKEMGTTAAATDPNSPLPPVSQTQFFVGIHSALRRLLMTIRYLLGVLTLALHLRSYKHISNLVERLIG